MDSYTKAISLIWIVLVVCTLWPIASIHAETMPSNNAPVIGIGWLWDDDPRDCYKSKSTKCNNRACLKAVQVACEYKFSSEKIKKYMSQCIFGHLKLIRNKWSFRAIVDGCTINLTAKNTFDNQFGSCLADHAAQIYDADTYRRGRGFCRELVEYIMRLYPEK